MSKHIIVIDEGTSSTRVIAYDQHLQPVAKAQEEIALFYPQPGWVEQDASDIWNKTYAALKKVIDNIGGAKNAAAIGITNQRETTIAWDRTTLEPLARAIVWQDRRTAEHCNALRSIGHEKEVQFKTGLVLDPYFSATKMAWYFDHDRAIQKAYEEGRLAMGTVDSWLIANLTEGRCHLTDVTNAARTLLMDLRLDEWSPSLLDIFRIPKSVLPQIQSSGTHFGDCTLFEKSIPILSSIGDQQSALYGQHCTNPSDAKITYGTGAFLIAHTGSQPLESKHKLLSTRLATRLGEPQAYGLEGTIFNAGTIVKWLRDSLGLVTTSEETEKHAASLTSNDGVYIVPAFTGLGAPHWRPDILANISGLSWGTHSAHIIRAGLEAISYQTHDLLGAFASDGVEIQKPLRVDGGMVANDWLMQFNADICNLDLLRPADLETTALGAAIMAALELGWQDAVRERQTQTQSNIRLFRPTMNARTRETNLLGWKNALARLMR